MSELTDTLTRARDLAVAQEAALDAATAAVASVTATAITERTRADAAEAEVARLQGVLDELTNEPDPEPEPEPPTPAAKVRIGMSAPAGEWDQRLRETGPVAARRLFGQLASPGRFIDLARSELAAGRMPVLSFKVTGDDWPGAAKGNYDAQLRSLASSLAALPGQVFCAIHHEPAGTTGRTPAEFAAMQRHVLPILAAPANVLAGVIVNGFWWSAKNQSLTDSEIAAWLPADVLDLCDVVAADCYQGGTTADPGEDAGVKIRRFSGWAAKVGITALGIGEYNGLNAAAIKAAGDAVLADPRFVFACAFNSSENNRVGVDWLLTGDRLAAFKATLTAAR